MFISVKFHFRTIGTNLVQIGTSNQKIWEIFKNHETNYFEMYNPLELHISIFFELFNKRSPTQPDRNAPFFSEVIFGS